MESNKYFVDRGASRYKIKSFEAYFPDQPVVQALIQAALKGDLETAKKMVAAGGDPNALGAIEPGSAFGFSPLHYALGANSPTAIRILAAVGADPEREASEMGMPLLFAVMLNNADLLSLLLDLKPIQKLTPKTQAHLLFESARRDAPRCLVLLLERGVPLDAMDTAHYTLFLRSFEMNLPDLALWLLQRGAAIDIASASGATAIDLLQRNLDKTARNSPNYPILLEVQRLMKERGAVFPKSTELNRHPL